MVNQDRKAYLFAWNAEKRKWPQLEEDIEELERTGTLIQPWSCAAYKSINIEDRAFLIKLGRKPAGIIGAGIVCSEPFSDINWRGAKVMRVLISFDKLLNPYKGKLLPIDALRTGKLSAQHWSPQSSGISIKPALIAKLEDVWADHLETLR